MNEWDLIAFCELILRYLPIGCPPLGQRQCDFRKISFMSFCLNVDRSESCLKMFICGPVSLMPGVLPIPLRLAHEWICFLHST